MSSQSRQIARLDPNPVASVSFAQRRPVPQLIPYRHIPIRVSINVDMILQVRRAIRPGCACVDVLLLKSLERYIYAVRTPAGIPQIDQERSFNHILWPDIHDRLLSRPRIVITPSPVLNRFEGLIDSEEETEPYSDSLDSPPTSSPSQRRRLHFLKNMPQPSLLAIQVANRVIKYARCARTGHEKDLSCLDCGLFPIYPVTGKCGHTRCTKCIEIMKRCPCGDESGQTSVNVVIRDLLVKTANCRATRGSIYQKRRTPDAHKRISPVNKLVTGAQGSGVGPVRKRGSTRRHFNATNENHVPITARARFAYALELLQNGRHKDAAPYLALAAASSDAELWLARSLLGQVVMLLSNNRDPRALTRELNYYVRQITSKSWINIGDMQCSVCCDTFTKPMTTPCGHMFCRTCLERTLDYTKRCPLCQHQLVDFKISETKDTFLIQEILSSIDAVHIARPMEEENLIPIFVCTVAFPFIPCPLIIFDPRYWMMIRRVLESGSRRFGMVAMDKERKYADFGTILEVRDCVHFEDGRSILSTVGVSRFKVIERTVRDGCDVARITPVKDIMPSGGALAIVAMKMYASQIELKALLWLSQLDSNVVHDIENAFGNLLNVHQLDDSEDWFDSADGPAWLWWLVAILPLRTEIKMLILSTDCLVKRMMAVYRTLEALSNVRITSVSECYQKEPENDQRTP